MGDFGRKEITMSPPTRTPQQRDRRFARVRRLTQTIFVGAGIASGVLVGFSAANAKPVTTSTATVPTTVAPATSTTGHSATSNNGAAGTTTVPVTAPVTTTTVCTTSPSGTVTCY